MGVNIPSNDAAFGEVSRIVIDEFGRAPRGFIGIDIYGGLVDPTDETHAIINVDRDEFVKQVRAFLDDIEAYA